MPCLPSLETLSLGPIPLESSDLANLLHGLEQSVCARRLRGLRFRICADGANILGIAIGRDSFPSLENLDPGRNPNFGDEGVTYLAQCLQASSRIKLTSLGLFDMGMGDAGLEALADVIRSGALMDCTCFLILEAGPLQTVIPLARGGGLKKVTRFLLTESSGEKSKPEPEAVVVLAYSLMEHCPALYDILLPAVGPSTMGVIEEIRDSHGSNRHLYIRSASASSD